MDHRFGNDCHATWLYTLRIGLLVMLSLLCVAALPAANAADSHAVKINSRRVHLDGPGGAEAMPCDVFQVLDGNGDPRGYQLDVDSVVCGEAKCEVVKVRIHFDPLGNYKRYELPTGGNLTKWGHKSFSRADHERLHQILSDPYSPLKTIEWDQITKPQSSAAAGDEIDGMSGATILSKRSVVVVGAAYTCCTLWHWSHGDAADVIREMTVRASDKQDWLRFLQTDENRYVVFAMEQLRTQRLFDAETITAVVHVLLHGSEKLADPAVRFLEEASRETSIDCFFRLVEDECLAASSIKRVQFLEAVRDTTQELPARYPDLLSGWLAGADSYYEVHLLLSLLEQLNATTDEAVRGATLLLEADNALVVRRSYRYLKTRELTDAQRKQLEAFERQHPNP